MRKTHLAFSFIIMALAACGEGSQEAKTSNIDTVSGSSNADTAVADLAEPFSTRSVKKYSKVIGWPSGKTPVAPAGFTVTKFADKFKNPRWIYVAPNGDILISEANSEPKGVKKVEAVASGKAKSQQLDESANRVTLLRDTNRDGTVDLRSIFLQNLKQPLGMLILKDQFYVANTDGLFVYPYKEGQVKIAGQGKKILELPAGGYNNHWTRNIISNKDQTKIYVAVGSASNIGEYGLENEVRRANILEVNPDGTGERIFASGLRNPVGMGWAPGSSTLWTTVNERDELGDELVPDYLTSVKENGFYGWPFSYLGQNPDPRLKGERPDLVASALVPEVMFDAHSASLGLAFYDKDKFPAKYQGGAFIGQHGSWNRSTLVGYKVVFVPFSKGRPTGAAEDFLTGFIANSETAEVYGRPVGVAVLPDGSLLVADDTSNTIWRVAFESGEKDVR